MTLIVILMKLAELLGILGTIRNTCLVSSSNLAREETLSEDIIDRSLSNVLLFPLSLSFLGLLIVHGNVSVLLLEFRHLQHLFNFTL